MLKILWKRGKIAPEEQFLPLSTIFYYLMLDFFVKTGIRFSLRDKRLFEITEVEITRVNCIYNQILLLQLFMGRFESLRTSCRFIEGVMIFYGKKNVTNLSAFEPFLVGLLIQFA